ncbi:hypothetical protein D3C86_2258730 [compost metagenome]
MSWQAVPLEISACPFPSMVEESNVVVLLLQRFDLAVDEGIELFKVGDQLERQIEVHVSPCM